MRIVVPVMSSFRAELENIEPTPPAITPLDLDSICRTQISLLQYVESLCNTLVPLGWTYSYDRNNETVVFENPQVPAARTVDDVVSYLRNHLPADDAETAPDYVKL